MVEVAFWIALGGTEKYEMSLDYFPGQHVVCVVKRARPPLFNEVYMIAAAGNPCWACGLSHVRLGELEPDCFYPGCWFRPADFREMAVLRGLLTPDG